VFESKGFYETVTKYRIHQEYIAPYTPEQNGMIERFFRGFKEECVWQHNFISFDEAYTKIADWIDHYNFERPHSMIRYATQAGVRKKLAA
jgi:putative transposase